MHVSEPFFFSLPFPLLSFLLFSFLFFPCLAASAIHPSLSAHRQHETSARRVNLVWHGTVRYGTVRYSTLCSHLIHIHTYMRPNTIRYDPIRGAGAHNHTESYQHEVSARPRGGEQTRADGVWVVAVEPGALAGPGGFVAGGVRGEGRLAEGVWVGGGI